MIKNFIRAINSDYIPRYELYNKLLLNHLNKDIVWVDIGSGKNEHIAEYGEQARLSLGIDCFVSPDILPKDFIKADLLKLPLKSNIADLITLRMVVEHIKVFPDDLIEINRVLKPNGKLIILTTNKVSPIIFFANLFPNILKQKLILKIFKINETDVFKTYHKFNTPKKIRNGFYNLKCTNVKYVEIIPERNSFLILLFGLWYFIVKHSSVKYLRSNILAEYQKED